MIASWRFESSPATVCLAASKILFGILLEMTNLAPPRDAKRRPLPRNERRLARCRALTIGERMEVRRTSPREKG